MWSSRSVDKASMSPGSKDEMAITESPVFKVNGTVDLIAKGKGQKNVKSPKDLSYLPGVQNVVTDQESRSTHDNMEWQLNNMMFSEICNIWCTSEIDLFASKLNNQLPEYGIREMLLNEGEKN